MVPTPAERAVVEAALARGFVTSTQLEGIRRQQAQRTASGQPADLLPILAEHLDEPQRAALRSVYQAALTSTAARAGATWPSSSPAPLVSDAAVTVPSNTGRGSRKGGTPEQIGGYELLRELGRGGMGVVYEARDLNLDRRVALKVLLAGQDADETDIARFQVEAKAAARLEHPNIVGVLQQGQDDAGHWFIAMELIDGESVHDLLEREGALDPDEAAEIACQTAEALAYAHEQSVLHRDLKPHNILLDANGDPHVTDFGLAKLVGDDQKSITVTGAGVIGTPAYMSPEQASGDRHAIDHRTDVYSLGATLYTMLTGALPFDGESLTNILLRVLEKPPRPPSELRPDLDPDLETIVLKALEKDPADRYANAGELAKDLSRYLKRLEIVAQRPSAAEQLQRWVRGNKGLAAGAAAAVLVVVLGGLFGLIQARKARHARALARAAAEESARKDRELEAERERLQAEQERITAQQARLQAEQEAARQQLEQDAAAREAEARQRLEDEARQREAEARQRLEDEARQREAEARQRLEDEARQREAEARQRLEDEARQRLEAEAHEHDPASEAERRRAERRERLAALAREVAERRARGEGEPSPDGPQPPERPVLAGRHGLAAPPVWAQARFRFLPGVEGSPWHSANGWALAVAEAEARNVPIVALRLAPGDQLPSALEDPRFAAELEERAVVVMAQDGLHPGGPTRPYPTATGEDRAIPLCKLHPSIPCLAHLGAWRQIDRLQGPARLATRGWDAYVVSPRTNQVVARTRKRGRGESLDRLPRRPPAVLEAVQAVQRDLGEPRDHELAELWKAEEELVRDRSSSVGRATKTFREYLAHPSMMLRVWAVGRYEFLCAEAVAEALEEEPRKGLAALKKARRTFKDHAPCEAWIDKATEELERR